MSELGNLNLQLFAGEVTPITGTDVEVNSNTATSSTVMSAGMKSNYRF